MKKVNNQPDAMSTDDPILNNLKPTEGIMIVDRRSEDDGSRFTDTEAAPVRGESVTARHRPYESTADEEDIRKLADWKNFNVGPDRVLLNLYSDTITVKKEQTGEVDAEGKLLPAFWAPLFDTRQGCGKVISVNKRFREMANEQYGLDIQTGDILLVRRGSGDFFSIAGDDYVAVYLSDIIALVK